MPRSPKAVSRQHKNAPRRARRQSRSLHKKSAPVQGLERFEREWGIHLCTEWGIFPCVSA